MVKGLAKEHIFITHRYRQQSGDGQREGGGEMGGGKQRGGKWKNCNSVNNKLILKNFK